MDAWMALTHHEDPLTRAVAVGTLGEFDGEQVKRRVLAALDDPSTIVRIAAVNSCANHDYFVDDQQRLSAVTRLAREASGEYLHQVLGSDGFRQTVSHLGGKAAPLVPDLQRAANELRAKPQMNDGDETILAKIAEYMRVISGGGTKRAEAPVSD